MRITLPITTIVAGGREMHLISGSQLDDPHVARHIAGEASGGEHPIGGGEAAASEAPPSPEPEPEPHPTHVVGPFCCEGESWKSYLCPVCDRDKPDLADVDPAMPKRCTVEWLTGRHIQGNERCEYKCCEAFETDPYEGEDVPDSKRRFFYYHMLVCLSSVARGGAASIFPRA